MAAEPRVVGLGLCVYDLSLLVDGAPTPDTKVDAHDVWHGGGGPVPNTLVTLAGWGVPCAYVGTVGDDLWGRALREQFVRAGVDVSAMRLASDHGTPVASLLVDAHSGQRTAILGGEPALAPPPIPKGLIENAAVIHMDARHPESCLDIARSAQSAGVSVSLDVGSPRVGGLELLGSVDHLVIAERFARFASKKSDAGDMLSQLWRPDYQGVVITRGEDGSIGRDRAHECIRCDRFEVNVVDTTGAGDVYHAGYLLGLLEGWDLQKRMQFGSAAAALACTKLGARGCLPTRAQVESLLANKVSA